MIKPNPDQDSPFHFVGRCTEHNCNFQGFYFSEASANSGMNGHHTRMHTDFVHYSKREKQDADHTAF